MPNDITVTKNETPGSERWDVAYTADQAATVTKTMETGGTMLDRDIKVSVTTPAGSVSVPSTIGGTSATPYLDIGTHKLAMTKEVSVTPSVVPGYVASASASNVTVSLLSDVPGRNDSSMTVSGNTVTAPAGFYPAAASKAVGSGSATTPATTITPNAISISVNSSTGVITASNTQKTQSVTPTVSAGYVSSGTAGTITVSAASNTSQLTTQAAATIAPTESEQTAVAAGKYTTGEVKVGAISSTYVGSGITRRDGDDIDSVGETGYYTVQIPEGYYAENVEYRIRRFSLPTATSSTYTGTSKISGGITPGTANKYLNINSPGVVIETASYYQINGDANLIPANIADGVPIFGVTGSLAFSTIYSGSSAPSSSTGVNGDIYLQV